MAASFSGEPATGPTRANVSKLKAALGALGLLAWCVVLPILFYSGHFLRIPGYRRLLLTFHHGVKRLFNIYTVYEGKLRTDEPTLYVVNHQSYLDVFVLGSVLRGTFIAKAEVSGWPLFGELAKVQGTLFFERNTRKAREQIEVMREHLQSGKNLILFPEGTSTEGTHVEPFRSSLFEAAMGGEREVWVQPVTVAYTHYKDVAMTQAERDRYAWYLPMTIMPHFFYGLGLGRCTAKVVFHEPVREADFESRKAWAAHCEAAVRGGLDEALGQVPDPQEQPRTQQAPT